MGTWKAGLPLALEDPPLGVTERRLATGITPPDQDDRDIVGAAFAVNGRWVGAEIEGSHALFEQVWPSLLRSYAVEALAQRDEVATAAPSAAAIEAMLEAAMPAALPFDGKGAMIVDHRPAAEVARTIANDEVVQTTVVPHLASQDATTPEALVVSLLEQGTINGTPIDSLDAAPVLVHDAGAPQGEHAGAWSLLPAAEAWDADDTAPLEAAALLLVHAVQVGMALFILSCFGGVQRLARRPAAAFRTLAAATHRRAIGAARTAGPATATVLHSIRLPSPIAAAHLLLATFHRPRSARRSV
jgi:hypothetical protein